LTGYSTFPSFPGMALTEPIKKSKQAIAHNAARRIRCEAVAPKAGEFQTAFGPLRV